MAKRKTRSVKGTMTYLKRPYTLTYRESKPTVFKLQMVRGSVIGGEEVVAYAAQAAHVPESTVQMAMNGMFDAINYYVTQGRCVQIAGLGSFKPTTRYKVAQSEEDCTVDHIKGRVIQFFPKGEIADLARYDNISFSENKTLTNMACGLLYNADDTLVNAEGKVAIFEAAGVKYKYVGRGSSAAFQTVTAGAAKNGVTVQRIEGNTTNGKFRYGSFEYTVETGKITDLPSWA